MHAEWCATETDAHAYLIIAASHFHFRNSTFDIRQLTEARGERPERKRGCNVVEMEMEMVIMTSKLSCINNGGEHVPLVVAVVFAFRWWSKCKCRLLLINRYWDTGKNKSTAGYQFF